MEKELKKLIDKYSNIFLGATNEGNLNVFVFNINHKKVQIEIPLSEENVFKIIEKELEKYHIGE